MDLFVFLTTPQHMPGTVLISFGLILGFAANTIGWLRPKISEVPVHLLGDRYTQNMVLIVLSIIAIACLLLGSAMIVII